MTTAGSAPHPYAYCILLAKCQSVLKARVLAGAMRIRTDAPPARGQSEQLAVSEAGSVLSQQSTLTPLSLLSPITHCVLYLTICTLDEVVCTDGKYMLRD